MHKYVEEALIEIALELAKNVHANQCYNLPDRDVDYFSYHILNVFARVQKDKDYDNNLGIVAILQDVLEDCDYTQKSSLIQSIRLDFGNHIVDALFALDNSTRAEYSLYIEKVAKNSLARRVKIYDLQENLYHCLMPDANKHAKEKLLPRYVKALAELI